MNKGFFYDLLFCVLAVMAFGTYITVNQINEKKVQINNLEETVFTFGYVNGIHDLISRTKNKADISVLQSLVSAIEEKQDIDQDFKLSSAVVGNSLTLSATLTDGIEKACFDFDWLKTLYKGSRRQSLNETATVTGYLGSVIVNEAQFKDLSAAKSLSFQRTLCDGETAIIDKLVVSDTYTAVDTEERIAK